MKRRRFVALVSSMLLIMSMVVCIAVPAFAYDQDYVPPVPYPDLPFDDYIVAELSTNSSSYHLYVISFVGDVSYNSYSEPYSSLLIPRPFIAYYLDWSLKEWVLFRDDSSVTSGGPVGFNFASGGLKYTTVDIFNLSGDVITQAPLPPKPPLVAATEGANLGAVMSQVVAILPIGLGCLAGYLGLRKALAFCRRILSGA